MTQLTEKDTNVIDKVFQVSELVEPYRVAHLIDLEENLNFHVFDDSLVDVDAEELNVVLSSSGLENVDEEDDNHIEECDETDNNSIDNGLEGWNEVAVWQEFKLSFISGIYGCNILST
jgi:hypothetical protein